MKTAVCLLPVVLRTGFDCFLVQTLDGNRQQVRLTILLIRNEWVDSTQLHVDLWLQQKSPRMRIGHLEKGWDVKCMQPTLGDSADAASRGSLAE